MFSIDDHPPPDPSSSDHQIHHQQQVLSHDPPASVSDLLKNPTLDDTNNPLFSFSIRDYVFGSRSTDITCNWPFSRESLQLCLHYGVKNFLPPFQSLDLLRSTNTVTSISRFAVINGLQNDENVIGLDDKSTDNVRFVSANLFNTESQCHLEENLPRIKSNTTLKPTAQPTIKKGKIVMKSSSDIEQVKEITPNNFVVSKTMVSKVCPVCKTFSSSSNTTLNAHIDQCLSKESSVKLTANRKIMVTHRIKPRKTRLMVDIYETAPRCSVEELDRRNGASWVTKLSFPDQELEFHEEKKKDDEPHKPIFVPEVADCEGAVYIDTNGTKVRILSMAKVDLLDDNQARMLQEGGKRRKNFTERKKKKVYGQKNCRKATKLSPESKKSLALKPHHGGSEEISGQEENLTNEEGCNKEDQMETCIKARVSKQTDDLAIKRRPLACFKRNGLPKRFSGATKDLLVENEKSSSGYCSRTIPSSSKNMSSVQCSKKAETSSAYREKEPLIKYKSVVKSSSEERFPIMLTKNDSYEDTRVIRKKSKKNLLSRSRESNVGSKFNFKRKFSELKNSHVHMSENAVMEPSYQNSSKQISRLMEEHTSEKLSLETANAFEAKKENSHLITLESFKNEDSSHSDDVCIDVQQSYMGLTRSFKDEFSNNFRSHECMGLHQGSLDYIENITIGHNVEDHTEDSEKKGNYFCEFDPIPIPSPPGSFLPPSPGEDMESEELQDNSSLTTMSRVQSTEDQHNHDTIMNKDCISDSPISTISSPTFAMSGSRSSHLVDAVDKKYAQITFSSVNTSDLRSVDATFTETVSIPSNIQNDQPYCCSRSVDTFSKNLALDNQNSSVLESNKRSSNTNFMSKFFPLIPEHVKLPVYKNCEPAAIRPSTPVLRLMGKNLTIYSQDR